MGISDNLTDLNYERYKKFDDNLDSGIGEPAIYTFKGDVFLGLDAGSWNERDLKYAEPRLFILSGLYGVLKPSTIVQPYRLEMGTKLKVGRNENLYDFWANDLTEQINKAFKKSSTPYLINLASNEYSKALDFNKIEGDVIEINFREWRNEKWTFVSFNAKKARGMMARYIIKNQIKDIEHLKGFDLDGYEFNKEISSERELFFTK